MDADVRLDAGHDDWRSEGARRGAPRPGLLEAGLAAAAEGALFEPPLGTVRASKRARISGGWARARRGYCSSAPRHREQLGELEQAVGRRQHERSDGPCRPASPAGRSHQNAAVDVSEFHGRRIATAAGRRTGPPPGAVRHRVTIRTPDESCCRSGERIAPGPVKREEQEQ